ncbi:MAG: cytochrome b/b6 domain-containing protein [Gammaproteobacteria bacterium]|jgi:cytochrome b561
MRALLDAGWRCADNFRTQLYDARAGYGWLSIRLHWAAAIAVIMLWFIGNQMTAANTSADEYGILVRVHTSVAVTIYALLLYRVFRRLHIGFPGRSADQPRPLFRLARVGHYALLFCILIMLFSGPLAVWSGGDAIGFFCFSKIASPFGADEELHELLEATHRTFAKILFAVFWFTLRARSGRSFSREERHRTG